MQKKNIAIFSSSNMVFKNSFWKNFKSKFHCEYQDFSNIENINNLKNNIDVLFIIFFYEDIFNENKINNSKNLKNILLIIDNFTKKRKTKVVLSIIQNLNTNIINFSQKENNNLKLILNFKNKFFKILKKKNNLFFLDINSVFSQHGFNNCYDSRNWYSFRMRVSFNGLKLIIQNMSNLIERIYFPPSKVLIIDCDNTLWGGIIGEDGIEKIELGTDGIGKAYQDIQKQIKLLSQQGVLICICSKNNEKDVWYTFDNHPEMILKRKDITLAKINWNEKAKNIIDISKELNLNLESFVFLDDNPLERNLLKKLIPQVKVIDLPEDVSFWPELISNIENFSKFSILKEDKLKKEQYKKRAEFIKEYSISKNKSDFLKNIKIETKIEKLNNFTYARASQMTMKTNQFNFTTNRYTIDEIKKNDQNKRNLNYILKVKDRYGDHGYVSLIMIKKITKNNYFLKNFLTSCRILGRDIELWFLFNICKKILINKKDSLILEYTPSKNNILIKDFLKKNNFKKFLNHKEYGLKNISSNKYFEIKLIDFKTIIIEKY